MAEVDAELVQRVYAGERAAYEALVVRHYQRAVAVAHSVLGQDAAVEDVVQNAFVRAYEKLGSLSEPAAYPAWLLRIVRNEALGWIRRNKHKFVQLDTEATAARTEGEKEEPPDERVLQMRRALEKLKTSYREILSLKYESGLSYEDLADSLGISVANVEKRLYRARQALIKKMDT